MILLADSEGPDQIEWMRRLLLTVALRIFPKTSFRMARPIFFFFFFFFFFLQKQIVEISENKRNC